MKQYFVIGTNTDVRKIIACSLLCKHLKFSYFKLIQTGNTEIIDSGTLSKLTNTKIYDSFFSLKVPVSPYFADKIKNIDPLNKNTIENYKLSDKLFEKSR